MLGYAFDETSLGRLGSPARMNVLEFNVVFRFVYFLYANRIIPTDRSR